MKFRALHDGGIDDGALETEGSTQNSWTKDFLYNYIVSQVEHTVIASEHVHRRLSCACSPVF